MLCRSVRLVFAQRSLPFVARRLLSSSSEHDLAFDEFRKRLNAGNIIVDVREPHEYAAGKIGHSINIPLGDVEHALNLPEKSFQKIYSIPKPEKDRDVVFHCLAGVRSAKAMNIAHTLGYSKAQNFIGGYAEWIKNETKG